MKEIIITMSNNDFKTNMLTCTVSSLTIYDALLHARYRYKKKFGFIPQVTLISEEE